VAQRIDEDERCKLDLPHQVETTFSYGVHQPDIDEDKANFELGLSGSNPLFCLTDICRALNIQNATQVAQRLDEEYRAMFDIGLKNGQEVTFVTKPGLYTVILLSDSPLTKPIQKWVTTNKDGCIYLSTLRASLLLNSLKNLSLNCLAFSPV
jgi:hypothetical protein